MSVLESLHSPQKRHPSWDYSVSCNKYSPCGFTLYQVASSWRFQGLISSCLTLFEMDENGCLTLWSQTILTERIRIYLSIYVKQVNEEVWLGDAGVCNVTILNISVLDIAGWHWHSFPQRTIRVCLLSLIYSVCAVHITWQPWLSCDPPTCGCLCTQRNFTVLWKES